MNVVGDWFSSGRVVDIALVVVALEVVGLWLYWRTTSRGMAPLDLLANNAAGVCLMLALRAALTGAAWPWIAAAMAASLLAHVVDVGRRCRSGPLSHRETSKSTVVPAGGAGAGEKSL